MCLDISSIYQPKPSSPQIVYKFYIDKGFKTVFESPFFHAKTILRRNRTIKSARPNVNLTEYEEEFLEVKEGLHCFVYLGQLKYSASLFQATRPHLILKIAEFVGHPDHFVAKGEFDGYPSVVYTKLKFLRFVS